ncbi:hypothetical protein C8E86_7406 [Catellatospora citrea]|nr:hypothetical protein C8E86_7406 [Catellatospora citrea]
MHDFDIMNGATAVAAIEVTEDLDQAGAAWRAMGIDRLAVAPCKLSWKVTLSSCPTRPTAWAKSVLTPFLLHLEQSGAPGTTIYPDTPFITQIPEELAELGFVAALCEPAGTPGAKPSTARVTVAFWGAITHTDQLAEWAGNFTNSKRCEGEREKLKASGRDERHLAVVVPHVAGSDRHLLGHLMAVEEFGPPTSPVALPDEITDLWLISGYPGTPTLYYRKGDWIVLPPENPFSEPQVKTQPPTITHWNATRQP